MRWRLVLQRPFDRVRRIAYTPHDLAELVCGAAKFLRPILDLVVFIEVDATAVRFARMFQVVRHGYLLNENEQTI